MFHLWASKELVIYFQQPPPFPKCEQSVTTWVKSRRVASVPVPEWPRSHIWQWDEQWRSSCGPRRHPSHTIQGQCWRTEGLVLQGNKKQYFFYHINKQQNLDHWNLKPLIQRACFRPQLISTHVYTVSNLQNISIDTARHLTLYLTST